MWWSHFTFKLPRTSTFQGVSTTLAVPTLGNVYPLTLAFFVPAVSAATCSSSSRPRGSTSSSSTRSKTLKERIDVEGLFAGLVPREGRTMGERLVPREGRTMGERLEGLLTEYIDRLKRDGDGAPR